MDIESSMQEPAEENPKMPNLKKTKLCSKFQLGYCSKGSKCSFAHGKQELAPIPNFFKTTLCNPFMSGKKCRFGKKCKFAHGYSELRMKPQSTINSNPEPQPDEVTVPSFVNKISKPVDTQLDIATSPLKIGSMLIQFESLEEKLKNRSGKHDTNSSNEPFAQMDDQSNNPFSKFYNPNRFNIPQPDSNLNYDQIPLFNRTISEVNYYRYNPSNTLNVQSQGK